MHQFWLPPFKLENCKSDYATKAGKPNNLIESYGLFSLSSCLGKIVEKAVGDNLRKFSRQKNAFEKKQEHKL